VRESTPIDPRRRAFAEALGHAIADLVWCEIVEAEPQKIDAPESKSEASLEKEKNDTHRCYGHTNELATGTG
jgi:hypothetical protein